MVVWRELRLNRANHLRPPGGRATTPSGREAVACYNFIGKSEVLMHSDLINLQQLQVTDREIARLNTEVAALPKIGRAHV